MNYKTNFKALKTVYQIAEKIGLIDLYMKDEEVKGIEIVNVGLYLLKSDSVNDFCRAITGSDQDFEELEPEELESVILGFFKCTKESWLRLEIGKKIAQTLGITIPETTITP